MSTRETKDLIGKVVLTQDGREVGQITGFEVDTGAWAVAAVAVKLKRTVLEELDIKRPLMGSPTVSVPVRDVAGVGDSLILRASMANLPFRGEAPPSEG